METIAPGIGTDKHQQVASASSSRPEQLSLLCDANTHDIDQRVLRIGIRAEDLAAGRLHPEYFELPAATAEAVARTRDAGGRVVAVGTTTTRVLETCACEEGRVRPESRETDLFVRPGYRFRVVDALLTNFHLPRSSLLLLVAAFADRERILAAYAEAIAKGYRFYSYGDAMLIL